MFKKYDIVYYNGTPDVDIGIIVGIGKEYELFVLNPEIPYRVITKSTFMTKASDVSVKKVIQALILESKFSLRSIISFMKRNNRVFACHFNDLNMCMVCLKGLIPKLKE